MKIIRSFIYLKYSNDLMQSWEQRQNIVVTEFIEQSEFTNSASEPFLNGKLAPPFKQNLEQRKSGCDTFETFDWISLAYANENERHVVLLINVVRLFEIVKYLKHIY